MLLIWKNSLLTDEVLPLEPVVAALVPVAALARVDVRDADGGRLPLEVADDEAGHPHRGHVRLVRLGVAHERVPGSKGCQFNASLTQLYRVAHLLAD